MRATDRNKLINKSRVLYVEKDEERIATSNGDWLITGDAARQFLAGIVQLDLLPDGRHKLAKDGRLWNLEQGSGARCFELLERTQNDRIRENATENGIMISIGKEVDAVLFFMSGKYVLVNRSYWENIKKLHPGAQVTKGELLYDPVVIERDGEIQALIMPIKPHVKELPALQWFEARGFRPQPERWESEQAAS